MAQRIVDALETIKINEHHRHVLVIAPRTQHIFFQLLVKQLSIGQPCQRVVHGEVMHFLLGLLALGDVMHGAVQAHHLAAVIGGGRRLYMDRAI